MTDYPSDGYRLRLLATWLETGFKIEPSVIVDDLRRMAERLDVADDRPCYDLLAIIHRDGGHHTEKVGLKQSVKDAHKVWAELMLEVERLRAIVEVAKEMHDVFDALLGYMDLSGVSKELKSKWVDIYDRFDEAVGEE